MSRTEEATTTTSHTPLGKGGTAEVVRLFSELHGRDIAFKRPLPDPSASEIPFAKLAAREKALIFGQRFPGLVRILDSGTQCDEGLAMELCTGPTLDRVGKIESVPLAMNILSALAVDLAYLEGRGIIHADLKPHNFFLPSDWKEQKGNRLFYAKLSDFAFGRTTSEPEGARAGLGSVGYMAPETIASGTTSYQSDLFALGIIAYQVLTGLHPFMREDADPVKVNGRIRESEPEPIKTYCLTASDALIELVSDLLAKNPEHRPVSAWEVCQRLAACGASYPYLKALRPSHLLTDTMSYERMISDTLRISDQERARLDLITSGDSAYLLSTLTTNFKRGNLLYDGERFGFVNLIVWPCRVRSRILADFFTHPLAARKLHLRKAIIRAASGDTDRPSDESATHALIFPLLRTATIRRLSRAMAKTESDNLPAVVRLQTMAGELDAAAESSVEARKTLMKEHRNREALHLLSRVIELAEMRGQSAQVRNVMMDKADILKEQGDLDPAMSVYQQIIASYEGQRPDQLLAETYKDIGDLCKMRYRFDAGVEALNQAEVIYWELGDQLGRANTLNNLGNMYWGAGKMTAALVNYREALRVQRKLDAKAKVASTLNNIAGVYALSGRYTRATRIYTLSLNINKGLEIGGEIARILNNLGYVYSSSGHPEKAAACLKESLELNQRIGSKREVLFNLENLAQVMVLAGDLKESLDYLHQGLELCEALEDYPRAGVISLVKVTVLKRIGLYGDALGTIGQIREILKVIDDPNLTAETEIAQAAIRYRLGDTAASIASLTSALSEVDRFDNKPASLTALLHLARISDDPVASERARKLITDQHLNREAIVLNAILLDRSLQRQNVSSVDRSLLKEVIAGIESLSEDIELPYICSVAAQAMLLSGDAESAEAFVDRGITLAERSSLLPEFATLVTIKGRLAFRTKSYESAFAMFKRGLEVCNQISENIPDDDDKAMFQKTRLVQDLTDEIRRLGEFLTGKKEGQPHGTRLPGH